MSLTRQIWAEMQSDNGSAARPVEPAKKRTRKATRPEPVESDPPEPALAFLEGHFGTKLMTISELSRNTGYGRKLLRWMVRHGFLDGIKTPGSRRVRYSPVQLARVLREYNQKGIDKMI